MGKSLSSKYWRFTLWDMEWIKKMTHFEMNIMKDSCSLCKNVRYIICQLEKCPSTGRLHYQGYVQLMIKTTYKKVLKLLHTEPGKCNVGECNGDDVDNYYYCTDIRKRTGEGFFEVGIRRRVKQGFRSDLTNVKNDILAGSGMWDMFNNHTDAYFRYGRMMKEAIAMVEKRNQGSVERDVEVWVHYGKTYCGKTTSVTNKYGLNNVFILSHSPNNCVYFDGYEGEKVLLIDDFYGWMPLEQLMRITDKIPYRTDSRGKHGWANWDKVYITSNCHPRDWYHNVPPDKKEAFLRTRMHHIIYFDKQFFKDEEVPESPSQGNIRPDLIDPRDYLI